MQELLMWAAWGGLLWFVSGLMKKLDQVPTDDEVRAIQKELEDEERRTECV